MNSRRDLKKQINQSMSLLYSDCIVYKVFTKGANLEKADALIDKIAGIHSELLNRISVSEGKDVKNRVKTYYKKLNDDLKTQINDLGKEVQELD